MLLIRVTSIETLGTWTPDCDGDLLSDKLELSLLVFQCLE